MSDRDSWLEAGAFEVADGVHRIPLPLPDDALRGVNIYAIADGDGVTLIDSGWALVESEHRLEAGLNQLGYDLGSIQRFLVTHVHQDHYSQAVAVRRRFGTRVALGLGERDNLRAIQESLVPYSDQMIARFVRAGAGRVASDLLGSPAGQDATLDKADWTDPDEWLRDGDVVAVGDRQLSVIATPGHTSGHIVFHDPAAQLMFSGDHILSSITPSIGFEPAPTSTSLSDYLSSLERIAAIVDSTLLPAHGPVRPSTADRVDALREHHRRRLDHTLAGLVAGGVSPASEVAQRLRWTRHERRLEELSSFNQMLAINETLAHLEVLAKSGLVEESLDGGVAVYQVA